MEAISRFVRRVDFTDDCWLWTGPLASGGYSKIVVNRKGVQAHRFSYEWFVGPVPQGKELDHLCRVRHCVNPDHLEPVTRRENVLRSPIAPAAINARKTHCKRGHEYTPENTYIARRVNNRVERQCVICQRIWHDRRKWAKLFHNNPKKKSGLDTKSVRNGNEISQRTV